MELDNLCFNSALYKPHGQRIITNPRKNVYKKLKKSDFIRNVSYVKYDKYRRIDFIDETLTFTILFCKN